MRLVAAQQCKQGGAGDYLGKEGLHEAVLSLDVDGNIVWPSVVVLAGGLKSENTRVEWFNGVTARVLRRLTALSAANLSLVILRLVARLPGSRLGQTLALLGAGQLQPLEQAVGSE